MDAQRLSQLRTTFRGDVILPADAGYDQARRVWNGMIDRRPALVVRPVDAEDAITAVRFGRDNDLVIAVRGGGHSLPGLSTCDDGLVIGLSRMRGVTIDPQSRTARVKGGSLLGELDIAAQEHGLVCPVGVVSHTGVGGLTLGGGMGRLQRKHGFTIDNLHSVEVVTADGRQVRASESENAELFWGMRGAGANFGVVTEFEFGLHPYDGRLTVAYAVHPGDRIAEAWAIYRDFMASAPDHMMASFNMSLAWEGLVPDEMVGKPVVKVTAFHSGDVSAAADELRPLLSAGSPIGRGHDVLRYLDVQRQADEASAWGHRVYTKGGFTDDLPAAALESMVDHLSYAGPNDLFGVWSQGGQISRIDEDAMAFTGRSAPFQMSSETAWDDPTDDENRLDWARAAFAIAEPHSRTGRYVNDVADSGADLARWIYGDAKYDRLVAVKRAWDPDNVFRLNQNIKP